jgi:hypothetical protein
MGQHSSKFYCAFAFNFVNINLKAVQLYDPS